MPNQQFHVGKLQEIATPSLKYSFTQTTLPVKKNKQQALLSTSLQADLKKTLLITFSLIILELILFLLLKQRVLNIPFVSY